MIIFAMIITIIVGFIGSGLGYSYMNWPELGPVLAVAIMGAFLMAEIRKNKK